MRTIGIDRWPSFWSIGILKLIEKLRSLMITSRTIFKSCNRCWKMNQHQNSWINKICRSISFKQRLQMDVSRERLSLTIWNLKYDVQSSVQNQTTTKKEIIWKALFEKKSNLFWLRMDLSITNWTLYETFINQLTLFSSFKNHSE